MDLIMDVSTHMAGRTICALADAATGPALSLVKYFPEIVRAGIVEKAA